MLVAQRLFRTATPPVTSVLRPTGSVPDVTLVKPTKMAEGRITAAVVRAKLHILACDQPWEYDAIANSNAGNTDQATYTIPHSLDTNVAELWADAFHTASGVAGTPVDAIVHDDHFSITTLPAYTGPEVHVYSVEDTIFGGNAECATAVGVDGAEMEFSQVDVADATPTNLQRAVEAGNHLPAIVRWSRSQPPGNDRLPWHAETIPAATLDPAGAGGGTHAIAFATTAPPAARFEGLTQTIARVNAIESAFTEIARAQARKVDSIVQLTSSVAALVQHAGILYALPPAPPPTSPPRPYAAIAGAPAPADDAAPASGSGAAMDVAAAGAVASVATPAASPSAHGLMTPASTNGSTHVGASPSVEVDLNDGSMPVPDEAPVSRRTRLSTALATLLSSAPGTTQGTVEGPLVWAASTRRVRFEDEAAWDAEYGADTADERDRSEYVFFDDDDDDDDPGVGGDDTAQRDGESSGDYEARLNGLVPRCIFAADPRSPERPRAQRRFMSPSHRGTERRCGGGSGVPPAQVVCAGWPDVVLLPGLDGRYGVPRRGLSDREARGDRGSGRRVQPAVEQSATPLLAHACQVRADGGCGKQVAGGRLVLRFGRCADRGWHGDEVGSPT